MSSKKAETKGPRLGLFIANLLAMVVFGVTWYVFNIVLGNLVALRFLGWFNQFPPALSLIASLLPSTGQLLFEEHQEHQGRAKRDAKRRGIVYEQDEDSLDKSVLGFIALASTTLDIVGPALGIMLTVTMFGGEMAIAPAVLLAFGASWMCQRIAWKCFKRTIKMTWEALCELATFPFQTKVFRLTSKGRRGHSPAFQNALDAPRED